MYESHANFCSVHQGSAVRYVYGHEDFSAHPSASFTVCQTGFLAANNPQRSVLLLLLTSVTCGLRMGHPSLSCRGPLGRLEVSLVYSAAVLFSPEMFLVLVHP